MKPGADAFIDTNVLVYAIDSESRYYQVTRNALEREGLAYAVSPQIVFEFLSVAKSPVNTSTRWQEYRRTASADQR